MRVLGLDVGDVRIGVALSDPTGSIASPLTTIRVTGRDRGIPDIAALVHEHQVEVIVVGLPISLNGSLGPQAQKVKEFCGALASQVKASVETWDERLSTVSADRMMRDAGVKRGRRRELRDSMAATVVLQSYLDNRRSASDNGSLSSSNSNS
ncbi:MAG: Holliday junction resolvase RuvX [Dehalococcoidia bacterium]